MILGISILQPGRLECRRQGTALPHNGYNEVVLPKCTRARQKEVLAMKFCCLILGAIGLVAAQPTVCSTTSAPLLVRAEGLTERVGDILFTCTGAPSLTLSINLSVQLNTGITNRLSSGNVVTGTVLTADNGSGPQAVVAQPILLSQNNLIWNGVLLTFSSQGTLTIKIADVRANAAGIGSGGLIVAILSMSSGSLLITQSSLEVAAVELSLYNGFSGKLICAQSGSMLASTSSFRDLILGGTVFTTTRITEGFAGAFPPKSAPPSLNADSGTRFIVKYSNFPQAARLFVPNVVVGSDAVQPTAGGDFGLAASGGAYTPSANGSLLLALVPGADSSGAGGSPVFTPGAAGTVTFDAVAELQIVNGAAYAVYEVVDSNPFSLESAQFPTFLGLAPNVVTTSVQTGESVSYAPASGVMAASTTSPIPRFVAPVPPNDCGIVGDCGANYFPQLTVNPASLQYSLPAGGLNQTQYVPVNNAGGGVLNWTASVSYTNGSGWLVLPNGSSGMNSGTVRVDATAVNLGVGIYGATLTIDAGTAGRRLVAITLVVTPTMAPGPQITAVENAASFAQTPVVPGSLATIMGSGFGGKNVSVTFDGLPSTILFSNATQINLLVPSGLGASLLGATSVLVVTVDGVKSALTLVQVAPFAPGIFAGAVLNQDSTVNSVSNGAMAGSVIYFYATGLSGSGTITVRVGSAELTNLYYAGPAPGYPGVQQINVLLPAGVQGMTTSLYACGTSAVGEVCSVPYPLTVK
jgi:uncharacterized protein (TIGR03437 family)